MQDISQQCQTKWQKKDQTNNKLMNLDLKANMQINQTHGIDDRQARFVCSVNDTPALTLPFPLPLSDTYQQVEGMVVVFRALAVPVILSSGKIDSTTFSLLVYPDFCDSCAR